MMEFSIIQTEITKKSECSGFVYMNSSAKDLTLLLSSKYLYAGKRIGLKKFFHSAPIPITGIAQIMMKLIDMASPNMNGIKRLKFSILRISQLILQALCLENLYNGKAVDQLTAVPNTA